jgi:predicted permease
MSPLIRLWNLLRRRQLDDELRQELDTHLALLEEEELANGSTAARARQRARRRFGSPVSHREAAVESVATMWLENAGKDLAFAAHRLTRSPAFTVATVLTLALAIAANASIFAIVSRVVLNPLPYGDSARLIALANGMPSRNIPSGFNTLTPRLYYQYLDRARTLESLAFYRTEEQTLTGQGRPERIRVTRTTPTLISVLRVVPAVGRWFTTDEGTPAAAPVAVLSNGLWIRRFGQDPGVLGSVVALDGVAATIVGVMGPSYAFPASDVDAWIPYPMTRTTTPDSFSIGGIARLARGATIANVRAELDSLGADLEGTSPNNGYGQVVSTATTLIDATVGHVTVALWALLAAVGLVLLVACANIANLFLVRSEVRQREVALRRALGAGARGIAFFFISESVLLSVAGGVVGLALAWGAVRLLVALGPASLPRLHEVHLDAPTVAVTLCLSLFIALALGAVPLFRPAPLIAALQDGRANTASRGRHRVRQILMGGQVALALVLLVSSGLMLRSFQKLRAIDPGFNAASALTFRVGLPATDYRDRTRIVAAHLAIIERLSALPGVSAVSGATCLPLGEGCNQGGPIFVEGRTLGPGVNPPIVLRRAIAGGYFETMGMRIVRGRTIARGDVDRNEAIVAVNEALARILFPSEDPIGRRVRLGNPALGVPGWLTIAGVVKDTPLVTLGEPSPVPQLFMPLFSTLEMNLPTRIDAFSFVLRTAVPPASLAAAVRGAVAAVDARLALAQIRTLQDALDRASAQMAFTMVLLAIAATVTLALGVIGIYGVMSYIVSQRTGEIGVRLAMGAAPGSVARMIVRQGGVVAVIGLTAGLVSALAGSRMIESLLYGVSARDPLVFTATTLILLVVSLAACWLPARRAARLSPLEALRTE